MRKPSPGKMIPTIDVESAEIARPQLTYRMPAGMERKYPKLPRFSDGADDFGYFIRIFEDSTREHEILDHDNMERLEKALGGEARALVKIYLKSSNCVDELVQELRNFYESRASEKKAVQRKLRRFRCWD